jgi:hypothetical protein
VHIDRRPTRRRRTGAGAAARGSKARGRTNGRSRRLRPEKLSRAWINAPLGGGPVVVRAPPATERRASTTLAGVAGGAVDGRRARECVTEVRTPRTGMLSVLRGADLRRKSSDPLRAHVHVDRLRQVVGEVDAALAGGPRPCSPRRRAAQPRGSAAPAAHGRTSSHGHAPRARGKTRIRCAAVEQRHCARYRTAPARRPRTAWRERAPAQRYHSPSRLGSCTPPMSRRPTARPAPRALAAAAQLAGACAVRPSATSVPARGVSPPCRPAPAAGSRARLTAESGVGRRAVGGDAAPRPRRPSS